jgi:hypothetical protein
MKNGFRILTAIAVVTAFAFPVGSKAIPAWARKYNVPCSSCHFGGSYKLTKFGRDFMWRGYATKDAEYIEDPAEVKLLDYMSFSQSWSYTADKTAASATSFNTTRFGFTAGGPLYDHFGFLLGYTIAPSAGISYGHLEYNTDHAADSYFFARAGLLSPETLTLQFIGRPSAVTGSVGGGITSSPSSKMNGVAVGFRAKSNTIIEAGYVNGANSPVTGVDDSNAKDVWGTIEQWFDDFGSNVAVGFYKGTAKVQASAGPPPTFWYMDYDRWSVTGSFMRENYTLEAAWFQGNNELQAGGKRQPKGYYVGGAFNFTNDLTGYVNFEDFDRRLTATPTTDSRTRTWSFGVNQRLTQIGRATASVSFQEDRKVNGTKTNKTVFSVGLGWLF